ncbi:MULTISPECIES: hypothetical protein [Bacillaceae]|uniref:hypothetical protein n=1 Tax=Bacillaceae TaxID=186817 RepID=UPI001561593A|nr:hypothetical protein [Niallia circulans]NRG28114.1 hypothetical protein [Niallia circulans]
MKANEKLIKEIEEFDNAFPDGVFCIPRIPGEPRVKVRMLWDYCKAKGIDNPEDLSEEEMKQFLQY